MKKNLTVSIAIFIKDIGTEDFKIWTQLRQEQGTLFGKWEFPGGKIEAGETPEVACRREVHEEVGVFLPTDEKLVLFKYQDYSFEDKNICLFVFISKFHDLPPDGGQWHVISYQDKSAFLTGKIPPINHVIIDELAVYIKHQYEQGALGYLWRQ